MGVVGRTGSGKSSLLVALFRITECERGDSSVNADSDGAAEVAAEVAPIKLDGEDIALVPLDRLHHVMAIVPQEPLLFAGPVRENLDPFGEHSEEALWLALEQCHLAQMFRALEGGLEAPVAARGANLSVGERQLLCVGRALLRRHTVKILALDEATAAVDPHTDTLIQGVIRNHFQHCTVIAIAHRLNTILDFDRVLVVDKGAIVEFDSPETLVTLAGGAFAQLAAEAGITAADVRTAKGGSQTQSSSMSKLS